MQTPPPSREETTQRTPDEPSPSTLKSYPPPLQPPSRQMQAGSSTNVRVATAPDPPLAQSPDRWLSVQEAARHLSLSEGALRKALERGATRVPDGGTEAQLDGVLGRKLGRRWRVRLGARWSLDTTQGGRR